VSRTTRSATIPATPEQVWRTVSDPHHLPRWWPGVQRVEGVDAERFTEVLATDKGRSVRADFRVLESRAPAVRRWSQDVEGSPFEALLRSAETEVRLEPAGEAATRVTVTMRQRLRGAGALGGFMLRRATARRLEEALAGLSRLHGG
jgi:carbon monoxide dehydrogenase subunit G